MFRGYPHVVSFFGRLPGHSTSRYNALSGFHVAFSHGPFIRYLRCRKVGRRRVKLMGNSSGVFSLHSVGHNLTTSKAIGLYGGQDQGLGGQSSTRVGQDTRSTRVSSGPTSGHSRTISSNRARVNGLEGGITRDLP